MNLNECKILCNDLSAVFSGGVGRFWPLHGFTFSWRTVSAMTADWADKTILERKSVVSICKRILIKYMGIQSLNDQLCNAK